MLSWGSGERQLCATSGWPGSSLVPGGNQRNGNQLGVELWREYGFYVEADTPEVRRVSENPSLARISIETLPDQLNGLDFSVYRAGRRN
jgi:hypothetical protein